MNKNLEWLAKNQGSSIGGFFERDYKSFVKFKITFKDKSCYLTSEGWGTGTECWICWIDVFDRTRIPVCRASLEDCLEEAVSRIKRYLSGDKKCWVGINQEQIDKVFKCTNC